MQEKKVAYMTGKGGKGKGGRDGVCGLGNNERDKGWIRQ